MNAGDSCRAGTLAFRSFWWIPAADGLVAPFISQANRAKPVTHSVDIFQRQAEPRSPNSIQKRFRTDFRFRIGKIHFPEASMTARPTTFMAAPSSGNILCRVVALRMTLFLGNMLFGVGKSFPEILRSMAEPYRPDA